MTTSHPPRLADWLLRRLASGPKAASLIGDLHEQFQRGRSVAWYWRHAVKSIVVVAAGDLHHQPGAVLHALCAGWGAAALYDALILSPFWWVLQRFALDHNTNRVWNVVFPWSWLPLILIGGWMAGRVVVRFHPGHLAASLFIMILSAIMMDLPRLVSLSVDAWGYDNYRGQLAWHVASLAVVTLGVLVGGLSDSRQLRLNDGTPAD